MTRSSRGELEQTLEKAQAELDSLREQRSQQVKMTESIARQRDMYRVLLAQATGVNFPQQGNSVATPADFIQSLKILLFFNLRLDVFCFVYFLKVHRLRSSHSPQLPDVRLLLFPLVERRLHSSPWPQIQPKLWRQRQL